MDGNEHTTAARGRTQGLTDGGEAARAGFGRRDFLRAAGLGGIALAAGGSIAACAGDPEAAYPSGPSLAVVNGNNITLDFASDVDVLNYAYALEQLEAAFYVQVVANAAFGSIFAENERRVLVDIRDHEIAHRDFYRAALGANRIPPLTPAFGAINFASRTSVLETARTFEDLGVGAYNGAGKYLRSATLLTVAGKIVSIEARHASAIRDLLQPRTGAFAPNVLDPALSPQDVLAAADPFIVQNITVVNA